MSINDPIADMLTRIRNAEARGREEVKLPSSKMVEAIARILRDEGYIEDYTVETEGSFPVLRIRLKYKQEGLRLRRPAIQEVRRVSRPSRRVYVGADEIPNPRMGLGIAILSTPQGIMTGREARRRHLGGEVICEVW
jgi:small subunit ribosomal protein S8